MDLAAMSVFNKRSTVRLDHVRQKRWFAVIENGVEFLFDAAVSGRDQLYKRFEIPEIV